MTAAAPSTTASENRQAFLRWRIRVFVATWLCYAGYYFCRRPYYVAKSALGSELGFDSEVLGTIGAIYLITYALAQFAAGVVGHRVGPRVMLLVGMSVSIATNIAFGAAQTASVFMLGMALNGMAQATGWSACIGTMAHWYRPSERGTVMGLWTTNFQVGGVAANALAAFVLGRSDHHAVFYSGAAVLLCVLLIVVFNQRNQPADVGLHNVDDDGQQEVVDTGAVPPMPKGAWETVLLIGVTYFFLKLIRYALWSWAPFFLARSYGLTGDNAGYLSTLFDVFGIPGVIVTGFVSDRFLQSRRFGISLFMTGVLIASCLLLYTFGRVDVRVFAVGIALVGFSLYGPDALLTGAGAMDVAHKRHATLAAGIISGIGSCGPVVQELVIGRLLKGSDDLSPVFLLLLGSAVLAFVTLALVVWRKRHQPA